MNNNINMDKVLIKEDIVLCVEIINKTLLYNIGDKNYLSPQLKKEKDFKSLNKAKAAAKRLVLLLDEFSKD
jgi:hypothetical protein